MDSGLSGFVLDPAKCSRLSLGEKRALVHEIAHWSEDAPEILSSLTRKELLEIICAEMGKERKYTGYTKSQMIEHLLKLVSQKPKRDCIADIFALPLVKTKCGLKRQRQNEPQLQLPTDLNHAPVDDKKEHVKFQICENVACRATLCPSVPFCKRCSCYICHRYDDNKDPSLWLTCSSDSLGDDDSCGITCHLTCALMDERTGIKKIGTRTKLDGSFYCVSCGKVNGLMGTWRKQLIVAKEARRVDALCLRIFLGYKILAGTNQYKKVLKMVETALQILKNEVGPLDLVCIKMARGIVNRLSCSAEVQKLCASAIEAFDSMFSGPYLDCVEKKEPATCQIRFETLSPTSVIISLEYKDHLFKDFQGCKLWYRKSSEMDYQDKPTFIVLNPQKRFLISDLNPSTEYLCKVSFFSSNIVLGVWEAKWITPPSLGSIHTVADEFGKDEKCAIAQVHSQVESINSSDIKLPFQGRPAQLQPFKDINKKRTEGLHSLPPSMEAVSKISPRSVPPTPCKSNGKLEVTGLGCRKQLEDSDYEYSVRVIKWLERDGHIDENFRVKFLTWFSLKATMQERKVVSVFVDAMIDDPPSLAAQLMHTFTDEICREQKPAPRRGFCTSLWH